MGMEGDRFDVGGKTAIVTGASSGLGVTFARALAAGGANVVLTARRVDRLQAVAEQLDPHGSRTLAVGCDVADAEQVEELTDRAWQAFGRVDVLVNSAETMADVGPVPERLPHAAVERVLRVNLLGTWYTARAVGVRMLADGAGGSIINIASVAALGAHPGFPVGYAASKAAVVSLTQNLSVLWADRGVRVNAIAPGWFPSETANPLLAPHALSGHELALQPMGRVGDPDELVGALLFLASEASSYVNGHVLVVDGGVSVSWGAPRYTDELYAFQAALAPGLSEPVMPPTEPRPVPSLSAKKDAPEVSR
jgi:NAD(P)-dependent dehydrogenase (short-subunit alcohol dehydrogenase family)